MNKKVTFDEYVEAYYGTGALFRDDVKKGVNVIKELGFSKAKNLRGDSDPYYDAYHKTVRLVRNRINRLCCEPW